MRYEIPNHRNPSQLCRCAHTSQTLRGRNRYTTRLLKVSVSVHIRDGDAWIQTGAELAAFRSGWVGQVDVISAEHSSGITQREELDVTVAINIARHVYLSYPATTRVKFWFPLFLYQEP